MAEFSAALVITQAQTKVRCWSWWRWRPWEYTVWVSSGPRPLSPSPLGRNALYQGMEPVQRGWRRFLQVPSHYGGLVAGPVDGLEVLVRAPAVEAVLLEPVLGEAVPDGVFNDAGFDRILTHPIQDVAHG